MEVLEISGITDDSRKIERGYIFVAVKGLTHDGHKFIPQAIKNGAVVIVGEENPKELKIEGAAYVQVKNSRRALGLLAAAWYDNPAKKMKIIGVTGTDGKTTTANMIYHILKESGKKVGLVSTVSAKIGNKEYDTGFHVTNPEPLALQKFLGQMVEADCEYAVLEVTSHGLDQERVAGIHFEIGVLTNITHEHLDYHKTFTAYKKAKLKLFQNAKVAVLNKSDKNAKWIQKNINAKVLFYEKDLLAKKIFAEPYNQENATAAIMVAKILKVSEKEVVRALKSFPGVPGRMQEVKNDRGVKIIIDFAHTPNGLKSVLEALFQSKKGKLITVIACEGERDKKKRPAMAEIAGNLADITILNAIDIRSEKAKDIIFDMEKGIKKTKGKYFKIEDRRKAIDFALKQAQKGDTVVICGKGHEKSMNFGGKEERSWSDLKEVNKVLRKSQKIAVLGLGIEGRDLINFLQKQSLPLTIIDEKPKTELDLTRMSTKGVAFICGPNSFKKARLQEFDIIFRSPGIYRFRRELLDAEKKGTEVGSAIKLFLELCPAKIIGVTGTKGKGTTSTLIYEILKKSGKDVYLAGNIGKPYLELLPKLKRDSWVVLELSSFQLIALTQSPQIAVVLNITSDHLDWHKNREEYVAAKKNIVKYQKESDFAVLNADYKTPESFARSASGKVVFFSKKKLAKKYKEKLLLRGEHNLENIAAAVAVAKILKIKDTAVTQVLRSFKGLEHRLELVETVEGVTFYNDSFATGPQPTMAALASFSEPTTIVLGGFDKQLEYDELGQFMARRPNVLTAILIGDIALKIKKSLKKARFKGKIVEMGKPRMEEIVKRAFQETPKGGIVLLSPAAASFDMFKDYKERGQEFKKAVRMLE